MISHNYGDAYLEREAEARSGFVGQAIIRLSPHFSPDSSLNPPPPHELLRYIFKFSLHVA